ncbi:MAG: glycoside hydrolase family 9 protein [Ignavibacteriaceae bacterium]|nr:glycoside hydrolase family 9 protein [Ignavibacteriaceae bacterium]
MKTKIKIIGSVLILLTMNLFAGPVLLNKAGYLVNSTKIVFLTASSDSFFVADASSGAIVFRGKTEFVKSNDPATGLAINKGDFSSYVQSGKYYIIDKLGNKSSQFLIADTVFNSVYKKSLKGFYFQRCGAPLLQQQASIYAHVQCHTSDGTFHSSTDTTGNLGATGGWHDAGDYGKYIVNAGISAGTLLMAYEMFPDKFTYDDLNIPESGNSVPDILDEIRFELDWFFKMQRANGAVFTKCTREQFESFVMPQFDTGKRYIYTPSSTATADFTAVMARAYRVFKKYDAAFADKCLDAAKKAWTYLEVHPQIFPTGGFKNPTGTATGEYGDSNDGDERLWASAELFISTTENMYHTYYLANYKTNGLFTRSMSWPSMAPMANLTYLFGTIPQIDQSVQTEHKTALNNYCATLVARGKLDGLGVVLQTSEYYWGSNSEVLNKAILLIAGYQLTNTTEYYEAALTQFNYILGANGNDISFITGIGDKRMMHPHHRPSQSDPVTEPVPGLMAGGPNKNRDDDYMKLNIPSSTPPALCYVDNWQSYASNEICINWNAPLVFVAGYFNNGSLAVEVEKDMGKLPTEFHLDQNYPNPFNPSTIIGYQVSVNSYVTFKVYDTLGKEVATLVNEEKQPGSYEVSFSPQQTTSNKQIASGVYFYQLRTGDFVQTKKMIVLK